MLNKVIRFIPPILLLVVIQAKLGMVALGGNWLTTLVTFFVAILLEAMPFVLIGSLLSGAIEVFVPKERIAQLVPKNRFQAILLFGLLGIAFPVCECGIVPVIRRLLQKGVPLSCGITYLLAAPIVQPIVLAATVVAFNGNWEVAGLRILGGYLVAIMVGSLAAVFLDPNTAKHVAFDLMDASAADGCGCGHDHSHDHSHDHGHTHESLPLMSSMHAHSHDDHDHEHEHHVHAVGSTLVAPSLRLELPIMQGSAPAARTPAKNPGKQIVNFLQHSSEEFLSTGYYLIFGALLAACMQTFVGQSLLVKMGHGPFLAPLVMMVLAFTLSLCSAADAFVAATFNQFSIASRLAFLVMGPMVDIKLVAMYNGFLSRKATFFVFGLATLLSFVYAVSLHFLGVK